MIAVLLLASALSAGNAEFEDEARQTAAAIAVGRIERDAEEKGLADEILVEAMLADSSRHIRRDESARICRARYGAELARQTDARIAKVLSELGLTTNALPPRATGTVDRVIRRHFEEAFARARATACARQSAAIALRVKPDEADLDAKGEAEAREWLTVRVAEARGLNVFEENRKYISEKIVDPILADARKERKRQLEFLVRTRCEALEPDALAREIESNLRRNVAERKAKAADPDWAWGVFPHTLRENLPTAVERRIVGRLAKVVDEVPLKLEAAAVREAIAADPSTHRKAADSERFFCARLGETLVGGALDRAAADVPADGREAYRAYVSVRTNASELVRAVEARVRREVLPQLRTIRAELVAEETARLWPTLMDRTWYPSADLADRLVARSDYEAAVRDWRREPDLAALAVDGVRLEESDAEADRSVAAAFELARAAIAGQNAAVTAVRPLVLRKAAEKGKGFFSFRVTLKDVIGLLTASVEGEWKKRRPATLWGDGPRPANADEQHAALFPSVRERIELEARRILEEIEKPDRSEGSSSSAGSGTDECVIAFRREGGQFVISAKCGDAVLAERRSQATADAFERAVREVGREVAQQILKLK